MTTQWRETVACPRCGCKVSSEQPIKMWIRGHGELDSRQACLCIGDCDLWVQKYGTRAHHSGVDRSVMYIMLVEVKTHGRELDDSQRELLGLVSDLLRTKPFKEQRAGGRFVPGHSQNIRIVRSYAKGRRPVQLHCYGVHVLTLSGSTPEDSKQIMWDRSVISKEQLVGLLRYDLDPDTLNPIDHRSHKKRIDEMPALFGIAELLSAPYPIGQEAS